MTVTSYLEDVLMILMWRVKMKVLLPSQLEWPFDVKMQGVYLHTDYIFAVVTTMNIVLLNVPIDRLLFVEAGSNC